MSSTRPWEKRTAEEKRRYMQNFSIWHMLNKGYKIPWAWIEEEENEYKKEYYRKHNKEVMARERRSNKED